MNTATTTDAPKLAIDPRIKSEVVTQYTTTDEQTYTDPVDAARHQIQLDLNDIGQDWINAEEVIATGEDFAECCRKYADRLLSALQRYAEVRAATLPLAVPPRPGKKGGFTRPTAPADPPPAKFR